MSVARVSPTMPLKVDSVTQTSEAAFSHGVNMNHTAFLKSSFTALSHVRQHLESLVLHSQPTGSYDEMLYHFHASATLLTSLLDGFATYTEKTLGTRREGLVSWDKETTFTNPLFANLYNIKERTAGYAIDGGITIAVLRNLAGHYLPWLTGAYASDRGLWDARLETGTPTKSGLVISDLLFPLYNDARKAYIEIARLLGQLDAAPKPPPQLVVNAGQLG